MIEVYPSDWELNTNDLLNGLHIYDNPAYVYPPWALILLWPYRWMTARGSRIAAVLVAAWLVDHRRWTLGHFLLIVLNPYFIFTLLLSNVDVLVLILPIILWEVVEGSRWQATGRGAAMALLLVKPHVGGLVILYWLWQQRKTLKKMIAPLSILGVITIPISLIGHPPLILQWVENLRNPSASNQSSWGFNNIALASDIGVLAAVAVMVIVLGALAGLAVYRHRQVTSSHIVSALFLAALMVSPYTSHQSVVAAVMLVPSPGGVLAAYGIALTASFLGWYRGCDPWWTLLIGVMTLWLYREQSQPNQTKS